MNAITIVLLIFAFAPCGGRVADPFVRDDRSCEPISVEFCHGIGYNKTRMPNHAGNDNLIDAKEAMSGYEPLLKTKCSSQLQFFLCSVYFPMCNEMVQQSIGPCRPLCENVQRRCEPLLKTFGFEWPKALNCSKFPAVNNARTMCMKGPTEEDDLGHPSSPQETPKSSYENHGNFDGFSELYSEHEMVQKYRPSDFHKNSDPFFVPEKPSCDNLNVLVSGIGKYVYLNNSKRCAPKCGRTVLFDESKRNMATIWMGCLTGVSLLLTLSALVAIIVSSVPLYYPERALMFITLCYGLSSIGYLIRFFSGHDSVACTSIPGESSPLLVIQGLQNLRCTIIFVFQYYFTLVAAMWWLVLCGTWFFYSIPHFDPLTLQNRATVYHGIVWSVPGVLTVVILVRAAVEADELTGLCNVGNVNVSELLQFVILPNLICLVFGVFMLALGFITPLILGTRTSENFSKPTASNSVPPPRIKNLKARTPEIPEYVMVRLGLLAAFFAVPSVCLLVANFYEYYNRPSWIPTEPLHILRAEQRQQFRSTGREKLSKSGMESPNFDTFVMKICANLVYGICASIWVIIRVSCHFCLGARKQSPSLPHPYAFQAATPLTGSSAASNPPKPRSTPSPNYCNGLNSNCNGLQRPMMLPYCNGNTII